MSRTVFRQVSRCAAGVIAAAAVAVVSFTPSLHARGQGETRGQAQTLQTVTSAQAQALQLAVAQGLDYVPGEVVFKFRKGTLQAQQQRALMAIRSRPRLGDVQWSHEIGLIHDDTQPDARVLAQQLKEQGEIEYAEPNYIRHVAPVAREMRDSLRSLASGAPAAAPAPSAFSPNDPEFSDQWNFPLAGIPAAWAVNPGGSSSVIVAVIDTGMTVASMTSTVPLWTGSSFVNTPLAFAKSPDFTASRFASPRDLVFTPDNTVLDLDGHGTHVSSTIAEDTNNGVGLAGIAFNVKLMPIKVCLGYWETMIQRGQAGTPGFAPGFANGGVQCPSTAVSTGIQLAADLGARVINVSLGGEQPSLSEQTAIQYAVNKGAFVAIAMGNSFAKGSPSNPTEYPAFYAAGIDGAMSVAAVTSTKAHASYSSSGSYCEIAAPGGDVDASNPDTTTQYVWQATLFFPDQDPTLTTTPRFDRYAEIGFTGTSSASPHVAAVAALLMSQYPKLTPAQVETIIKATATDLGAKGRDDLFGFGLIRAGSALLGAGIAK
jgi:serine protease